MAVNIASILVYTKALTMMSMKRWVVFYNILSRLVVLLSATIFFCWTELKERHESLFLMVRWLPLITLFADH
jgi:hypothetical protein